MEVYVGTILLFAFNYAPDDGCNWMPCYGQTLQIYQYQALFAVLGTKYGGDGTTTFGLPNLKGSEPDPNMGYFIATAGLFPSRQ